MKRMDRHHDSRRRGHDSRRGRRGGCHSADPPDRHRQRRMDGKRAEDLRRISEQIDLYWKEHSLLPINCPVLQRPGVQLPLNDPKPMRLTNMKSRT
ncbi:MAG: hypothetical protein WDO70_02375 [Alphaproteobacteria bacterium]